MHSTMPDWAQRARRQAESAGQLPTAARRPWPPAAARRRIGRQQRPTFSVSSTGNTGLYTLTPSCSTASNDWLHTAATLSTTGTATVSVLDNRAITADTLNFGLVHVGAAASGSLTLRTSGDNNHFTAVQVPDATGGGFSVSGGTTTVFNGDGVTDSGRILSGTLSVAAR